MNFTIGDPSKKKPIIGSNRPINKSLQKEFFNSQLDYVDDDLLAMTPLSLPGKYKNIYNLNG